MSSEADVNQPRNASHGIELNLLELLSPSLNISSLVDDISCERWLPQVPNMVGWTEWLFACVRSWSCDFRHGPAVLVAPPRMLPQLVTLDDVELKHRFLYWVPFLLMGPVLMGIVCEGMRLTVRALKRRLRTESRSDEYQLVGRGQTSDSKDLPLCEMTTSVGDTLPYRFTCALCVYHTFCATLVLIALGSGWVVSAAGASFAWELWAVWQHACLWMLFGQTVLRCKRCDAEGLERTTLVKVVLYTLPGCSELADTMKDWILCGICMGAAPTAEGLCYGFTFVALDLVLRQCTAPRVFPFAITKDFSVWSPAVCLVIIGPAPALALVSAVVVWGLYMGFHASSELTWLCFNVLSASCVLLTCGFWHLFSSGRLDFTDGFDISDVCGLALPLLRPWFDGGFLFIVSFYIIVVSNVLIMSHPGCAQELRRTYRGVLALPMTKPERPSEDWVEWLSLEFNLVATDLVSSCRLLFAWAEDLPQGIIGLVLTESWSAKRAHGLGFAALSAIVSLVKGCLIPAGQGYLAARLAYVLRTKLDVWKPDFTTANLLGLPRQEILDSLQLSLPPNLRKHEESVIADMRLRRDLDLHEPVFAAIEKWSEQKMADELKAVIAQSVAALKEEGTGLQEVFAKGYSLEDVCAGGFALSLCLEAGIGLQECVQAGFRLPEGLGNCSKKVALDAHEMDVLKRQEAAHSVAALKQRGAGLQEVFAKGYSLEDVCAGGFALSVCLEAGIGLQECLQAKFRLPADLRNWSKKVALDAHEMDVLKRQEAADSAAALQEHFAKGHSLEAARAGGFALSVCLEAGVGLQECLQAGFRLPEGLGNCSKKVALDAREMDALRAAESQ